MKHFLLLFLALIGFSLIFSQTLSPGSIAIIGVSVDDEEVLLVALEDIPAGETVFFTDEEWSGTAFNSGEGFCSWVTPAITAGTVIVLTNSSASVGGTVSALAGSFALGNSGDGVFLYQTSSNVYNAGTYALIGFAGEDAGDAGTLTGTGLTLGTDAIYFGGDNGIYVGTRTGQSASTYLSLIYGSSWTTSGTSQTFNLTNFTFSGCSITSSGLANIACNNNGTNGTVVDDFLTFDLEVSAGSGTAATYNLAVSGGGASTISPTTGTYGSLSSFTLNNGSANGLDITLTITDASTGTCTLVETITDPGSCSVAPCSEPSQATTLVLDNETSSSIDVSFTGSGADNYLVVQSENATLSATPSDATTYAVLDALGGGTVVYNGSSSSFTDGGLLPTTTYYYFVFAFNDLACSGGPNYVLPALNGNATTLTGPTCFAVQDFDGTNSWTYTSSPAENNATCVSNGDVWNIVNSLNNITIPNSTGNFWGVQDLNGAFGCGTSGVGTLDFGTINVSSYNDVTISFDYEVDGFNAATDEFSYILTVDGNPQTEVFLCDGCDQQDLEGTETVNIPNGSATISLQIRYSVDGGSDYSGVDNFAICGVLASPEPEINVQGNATDIPDGNTAISAGDDTDFGDILVSSGSNPNTFTIQNNGTADLNLSSVVSSNATEFAVSGTTSGVIAPGNDVTFIITFDPNATGTRTSTITIVSDDSDESSYTFDVAGIGTAVPDIVLSSSDPAVPANNILADSDVDNTVIYAFDLSVTTFDAELTAFDFATQAGYAAGNITNFKAWYSADNTFNSGSDTQLDNLTSGLGAGLHSFTGFSQTITNGSTGYIFITADLPCGATANNTITVSAITLADLTFTSGTITGLAFAGGTQTITEVAPNNVTALATDNCEVGNAEVSWTDATGCSDNYLVVASPTPLVTAPSGDGSSYNADNNYGVGDAYDGGFIVYEGSGTSVSINGLTNGTNYTYTVFTRNGLSWSSGVAVDCTPVLSIPDNSCSSIGLSLGLNYSGTTTVADINVFVSIEHTWRADLNIEIASPSGTVVQLFNGSNSGSEDNLEVIFDDAGGAITTGDHTVDGIADETVTSDLDLLSIFNGEDPNGPWTLTICDDASGDVGTLIDWSIDITESCIPTHSFSSMLPTSGPEGTEVTITGTGFTASTTVSFGATPATVMFVDTTTLIVTVPNGASTGAITLLEDGCSISTGTFSIIEESGLCVGGTGSFTDIFISEVFDGDFGNTLIVELYNPTSSTINLTGYTIELYSNGSASSSRSIALTGSIASNSTYLASLGTTADPCSLTYDYNVGGSGINGDDDLRLFSGATEIDEWLGQFGGITGYSSIRKGTATAPSVNYVAADWDFFGTESCSDLGTGPVAVYNNPSLTAINDQSDCSVLDYSVSATEGDLTTTGDLTYQWYFNDGVSSGWTAVNATTPAGFTILGEDGDNLLIEGAVNPLSSLDAYQFYCAVVEDGSCENVSNAIKFELQSERFYKSASSGSWGDVATWEVSDSPAGPWTSACEIPNDMNSDYISIFDGHIVNVPDGLGAPDVRADQLIVQPSATLILEGNAELEIENGAVGSDFEIRGTFIDGASSGAGNGVTFNNGATWNIIDAATIIKTSSSSASTYRDNYEGGISTIPTNARWIYRYDGSGSITIANSASGSPMYYPYLSFESTSGNYDFNNLSEIFSGRLEPLTVKGDLTIGGNGNNVKVYNNNFNATPIQVFGLLDIAAGSELTNEPYTVVNGNYDVQWREGSGFEFYNDLFIDGTLDVSYFAPNTASSSGRVEPGQEKVVLSKAAGTQFIFGGTSETFVTNDLEVNAEVQLDIIDCVIEDELRFVSGTIVTLINGPDLVVVNNPNPSAIVNANTNGGDRYIDGKLKWTTDGSSSYTFPIGRFTTGGAQAFNITLNGTNGSEILGYLESNSTSPLQNFAYCDLETHPGGGTVNAGNGNAGYDGILDQIEFNQESFGQWNITNPNGGITQYDLTVLPDAGQDVFPVTTANGVEVRYLLKNGEPGNTGFATSTGAPSFTSTGFLACPNQYSLTGMTSFSTFTLNGASQSNTTLPVEMLYFKASAINNEYIQLDWATAAEINNEGFEIQRSTNGEDFETIGFVAGAGNSAGKLDYRLDDFEVRNNINYYYRLKQFDFDGLFEYSNIVSASLNDKFAQANINVFPVPTNGEVSIQSDVEIVQVSATDISGKKVQLQTRKSEKTTLVNLSNFSAGVYYFEITTMFGREIHKVIKQ